jgi:hypothetical protein
LKTEDRRPELEKWKVEIGFRKLSIEKIGEMRKP